MKDIISKLLFNGKENIDLLEVQDFAECGETNLIERKSILPLKPLDKAKVKEVLSKAISAFSNYSGGIILLGVDDNGKVEEGIENVMGNGTIKEWLEDIIPTVCSPTIRDFCVKVCKNNEKYIFVIVIGESSLAPHQAVFGDSQKGKYYSRIDGKSKVIDGVLVKDIFYRKGSANLDITFDWDAPDKPDGRLRLGIVLNNDSKIPAEYIVCLIDFSEDVFGEVSSSDKKISYRYKRITINEHLIYPEVGMRFYDYNMKLKSFEILSCKVIMMAKNMHKKEIKFNFRRNGDIVQTTQ